MKTRLSLRGRGVQLLSQREHSRQELRRKLLQHLRKAHREALESAAASASMAAADPVGGGSRDFPWDMADELPEALAGNAVDAANDLASAVERVDAEEQVDAVLAWLQEKGYFSEQRFVESRVHVRAGRYGNLRIRQELSQHGIALDADTAARLKDTELARAHDVWRRKFGALAEDAAGRAKQMRFLSSRGFSPEVIGRVVKGAVDVEGDEG